MKLADYNYTETENSRVRRIKLGKAVRANGGIKIKKALQSRKYRASGYKAERLRADINWLKNRYL